MSVLTRSDDDEDDQYLIAEVEAYRRKVNDNSKYDAAEMEACLRAVEDGSAENSRKRQGEPQDNGKPTPAAKRSRTAKLKQKKNGARTEPDDTNASATTSVTLPHIPSPVTVIPTTTVQTVAPKPGGIYMIESVSTIKYIVLEGGNIRLSGNPHSIAS